MGLKSFAQFTGAFCVLVLALAYPFLKRTYEILGPFKTAPSLNVNKCQPIQGPAACETLVVLEDFAYLACGNVNARLKWWPPVSHFDKKENNNDEAYVYDFKTGERSRLAIKKFTGDFRLHGMSAFPSSKKGKVYLAFVNHKRTGSCIELFEHQTGTKEIIHTETVCDPLIKHPNSIALVSAKSFYVTNYLRSEGQAYQAFEIFTRRKWSNVAFRNEDGKVSVAIDGLAGANGIVLSPTRDQIYVSSTSDGIVTMYERQRDGSLRETDVVELDFLVDNLSVVPTTGNILASGPVNARKFIAHVHDIRQPCPWKVVRIHNTTSQDKFYGKKYSATTILSDPGNKMSCITTSALHPSSNNILLGGLLQKHVFLCSNVYNDKN